jgi:CheY-like chemotaxis protein
MNQQGSSGGERRADRRYKVTLRTNLTRGDSREVEAVVLDLGTSGCFVESDEEVREGDLVKLRLDIPGRGDLTIWGNVVFWVRDTGFGVRFAAFSQGGARERLEELLNRPPTTVAPVKNPGGRMAVETHGGDLTSPSCPGAIIGRAHSSHPQSPDVPHSPAAPRWCHEGTEFSALPKILIVEDEPTVRGLLCELLSPHECVPLRSAEEGLVFLSRTPFDLVITDVRLPGMGGEEFLREARGLAPGLPIIVITGADGDEEKFIEAGAFGYLLKPFRFEDVEELVGRALAPASDPRPR